MLAPPIEPMLAKLADELPPGGAYLYEPKWDGFRAIVFRRAATSSFKAGICGRSIATFPSCTTCCSRGCRAGCVLDGEIVIAGRRSGLDFDALQLRLHPAASRVAKLAKESPSAFVAFDLLAVDGRTFARRHSMNAARGSKHCSPTRSRRCT